MEGRDGMKEALSKLVKGGEKLLKKLEETRKELKAKGYWNGMPLTEKEREIAELEHILGVKFPNSYRWFLWDEGCDKVCGYQILGLPSSEDSSKSILSATKFLRLKRENLAEESLIAISLDEDFALCLDLRKGPQDDAPLVEVNLREPETPPVPLGLTFRQYVEEGKREEKRFRKAYDQIMELRKQVERIAEKRDYIFSKFSHTQKGLYPRPQQWHPQIIRLHDYVVILTAYRYNYRKTGLEVDVVYAEDLPSSRKGDAIRNLTKLIFSEAYRFGGSLNVIFTKRAEGKGYWKRTSRPIPQELINLAQEEYGITFKEASQGKISHEEGVRLYWALLEMPSEIQEKAEALDKANHLSKQAICRVIFSGIWSREEAIWIFQNAPRPEAVLLGTDVPESRLLYSESVSYGRSALLVSKLREKILAYLTDGLPPEEREGVECILEPKGKFWTLRCNQGFSLPWMLDKSERVSVLPMEMVILLSLPRMLGQPSSDGSWLRTLFSKPKDLTQSGYDKSWLKENIKMLQKLQTEAKTRCFLLSYEFRNFEGIGDISKKASQRGIHLLFSPFRLDQFDEEVENRMDRARRLKRFSSRIAPLKLLAIEVSREMWEEAPTLYNAAMDARTFGRWIAKDVDVKRARRSFTVNCRCVERVVLQNPENRKVAEFKGKDSIELQKVLRLNADPQKGIVAPFIRPQEMEAFLKVAEGKIKSILRKVKGGVVVVAPPFESEPLPTPIPGGEASISKEAPKAVKPVKPPEKLLPEIKLERYITRRRRLIKRTHDQIREALTGGHPLNVTYIPHQIFTEVIRNYVYYREKPSTKDAKLRIAYGDGTEGEPFPLFCLPEKSEKPENLFQAKVGLISMRHVNLDLIINAGYLMRNAPITQRRTSAKQEDYAFRKTYHFLKNFVDLVQHERIEEITQDKSFLFKWMNLNLEERRWNGLELHIFQTGLEPAVVGAYKAVIRFLQENRGKLVVIPRLISKGRRRKVLEEGGVKAINEVNYVRAREWL